MTSPETRNPTKPTPRDVQFLPNVGRDRAKLLAKLGIRRAIDLAFFFPRNYEDVAPLQTPDQFVESTRVSFVGTINDIGERVTQSGKHMLGVQVTPAGLTQAMPGSVRLLWFNQPFRKNELRPGMQIMVTGVLQSTVLNWEMVHPQVTLLDDGHPQDQKPLPVYPLTDGLKQPHLRRIMQSALPEIIPTIEEVLPASVRKELQIIDIQRALEQIHFPNNREEYEEAQRRFKCQELLVLQLAISLQRSEREQNSKAPCLEPSGKIHARILNRLGLTLTDDQMNAIAEIGQDMGRETAMNRLLQGDVGSGKTVVAQYAMLLCVAHGFQAALMAPTEVLARQHAHTMQKSLSHSRVRTALLTGSLSRAERNQVLADAAAGEVDLIIGTQALLSDDVHFKSLGLVIVDEQHKFGVLQRAKLRTETTQPHYLVLSATPIPRTVAMTAFGDLDVSTIRQKPPGRAAVHTYTATNEELTSWWKFVDDKIATGRQAYVIAPRVESASNDTQDSAEDTFAASGGELASVTGVYAQLAENEFAHRSVGLLHGRLDSEEKQSVLADFAAGITDLLVATTVVEVGIDVPNATVMTILDANRMGLSQLHQLRGRISRGSHPGYCCAVATTGSDASDHQRLTAFKDSNDGFELAEIDLAMRGPGDLLGTSQSGLPPLRIANLVSDAPLLELARIVAREILKGDPGLACPEFEKLRKQTVNRYGKSMQLSDVG